MNLGHDCYLFTLALSIMPSGHDCHYYLQQYLSICCRVCESLLKYLLHYEGNGHCCGVVQVRAVCSEALCIAENIIHPRLPVVGVEALSRCIADSRSPANADSADNIDAEPFGRRIELGYTDDQFDVEPSRDNIADDEAHLSSVTEVCPTPAVPCTLTLSAMESSHAEEHTIELPAHGVVCSPTEETMTDVEETAVAQNIDATSPASGQELEKSDSVSFVTAVSSFPISPLSSTLSGIVRENVVATETFEAPTTSPTLSSIITQCSGSDDVKDKLPECSHTESQESIRKRKYSTASSVNDGDDSESEGGEIEVGRHSDYTSYSVFFVVSLLISLIRCI